MKKSARLILIAAVFAFVSVPLYAEQFQTAAAQAGPELENLFAGSDVVVLASVEVLDQKLNETRVRVAVQRVFKGDAALKRLEIEHRGGKFKVDFTEPSFSSYDKAILFLRRDGDLYRCVNGAQGKKTVVNDNVYLTPDNGFASMPLKKYVSSLEALAAKAVHSKP